MKCLFCGKEINDFSLYGLFIEEDVLCPDCRKAMKYHHGNFTRKGLKIEYFYEYDSLFRDLLLQYKECYDEALKEVFLYKLRDYLFLRYRGYQILYVPSSNIKREERGFDHLKLIFEPLRLKEVKGLKMKEDLNQVGKNYEERKKMENNYFYEGGKTGKVLIADDVYTTGSSLMGVYRTIRPYATEVRAIVLGKNINNK